MLKQKDIETKKINKNTFFYVQLCKITINEKTIPYFGTVFKLIKILIAAACFVIRNS